ncbi:MAG: MgtC/SapB family protein [Patescibacteria group bacterium]|nr:MgtC/SapB family protein [Patescibacteria group bacterium]
MTDTSLLEIGYRLILGVIIGAIIGAERSFFHKQAGLRTFSLTCLGATLFSVISLNFDTEGTARLLANIIVGIGFLGGGLIYFHQEKLQGVTTAAALWVTAAIGTAIGQGYYFETFITSLLVLLILSVLPSVERRIANEK